MSTIENAQFILDMRKKVLENREAGRPTKYGISEEEHRRIMELLRPARSAAVSSGDKKKSSSRKGPVKPMSDDDVDALFK